MSGEAVEYVRGIPVVKTFGQSVFSFKKFKATIDEYEKWVIAYTKELRMPMLFYTAAINGVFAFLIAGGLLLTRNGVTPEFLLNLLFYIIITPVISLTLTKIMYMSENKMIVADALSRIDSVLDEAPVSVSEKPQHPKDSSIALHDVRFSYDGRTDVIRGVSMDIRPGQTVALVGPSGGGKSTLASLICRFFDVGSGSICVGGADVRDIPKEELMDTVSFVFQNIKRDFGSFDAFKEQFGKAAIGLFGSGWTWLAADKNGKLVIVSESNAGNPLKKGLIPLLGIDVWEHSYYIDYRNRRADYVKNFWDIVDWKVIEKRFKK